MKNYLSYIALCLVGIFAYAFAVDTSPLINCPGTDSAVFIYIAKGMRHGLVPYLDMFDHKGPVTYLVQCFGLLTGLGIQGIWLLETAAFCSSLCYGFKWVRQFWGGLTAWIFAFLNVTLLVYLCMGGDLTETWAYPFVVLTLVALIKRVRMGYSIWSDAIVGFSTGVVLMLRPNMIAAGMVFGICILVDAIQNRSFRQFMQEVASYVVGLLVALAPILIWLAMEGALFPCWQDYIIFNLAYAGRPVKEINGNLFLAIYVILFTGLCGIAISKNERKTFWWVQAINVVTWLIVLHKPLYSHYFVILIPSLALAASLGIRSGGMRFFAYAGLVVMVVFLSYRFVCGTVFHVIHLPTLKTEYLSRHKLPNSIRDIRWQDVLRYEQLDAFRPIIKDANSVLVLGNDCVVYERLNARCDSKYFYQSPIAMVDESINEEVRKDIMTARNRYLIKTKGYSDYPAAIVEQAPYRLLANTAAFELYERQ